MSTKEEREKMLPAERAGQLPGIMWQSLLSGMTHHAYIIRSEGGIVAGSAADEHLHELENKIKVLTEYILDGKE